jgi:hypothetical protein
MSAITASMVKRCRGRISPIDGGGPGSPELGMDTTVEKMTTKKRIKYKNGHKLARPKSTFVGFFIFNFNRLRDSIEA